MERLENAARVVRRASAVDFGRQRLLEHFRVRELLIELDRELERGRRALRVHVEDGDPRKFLRAVREALELIRE